MKKKGGKSFQAEGGRCTKDVAGGNVGKVRKPEKLEIKIVLKEACKGKEGLTPQDFVGCAMFGFILRAVGSHLLLLLLFRG